MRKQMNATIELEYTRLFAHKIRPQKIKGTKTSFPGIYKGIWCIWWFNHLRHTTTEKYDNNGKGLYFRFDYDIKMIDEYILSIA